MTIKAGKKWYDSHHKSKNYKHGSGNWCITNDLSKIHYLFFEDIVHLLTEDTLKAVPLKSIGWRDKHIFPEPWVSERYDLSDVSYPGIITNGPNPYDNEYRMIDGRHRIHKLLTLGVKESLFYVIDWDKIKHLFLDSSDNICIERLNKFHYG
jgi:hypothetical protein|tara:strand:+ start:346 stop:801 length:456 start_codon:yes stop_codon:yes gene_type:complete